MATFKVKACGQGFYNFNDAASSTDNRYCLVIKDVTGTTKLVSLDEDEFVMDAFTVDTNVVVGTGKKLVCVPQESAISDLTDSSGGTANNTVEAIGSTYSQSEVRNNFADLSANVNDILAVLRTHKLIAT